MTVHQLYRFRFCPYAHAAQLALAAAGISVDVITLDKNAVPAWLLLASPFGTVPLLRFPDGGMLSESSAIADYAARATTTALIPSDARDAAKMREALSLISEGYRRLSAWRRRRGDVLASEQAVCTIASYLAARVSKLWFFSDSFTLVDAFAVPFLRRRQALLESDLLGDPQPELARWLERLEGHAAVRAVDATLEEETPEQHLSYVAQARPTEPMTSRKAFS